MPFGPLLCNIFYAFTVRLMPPEGTTIELTAGPPPLLTKRATGTAAIARLRSEAAILAAARHPGVVALVDVDEERDHTGTLVALAMTMRVAGSRTLASAGAVEPRRAAGLVAALVATVADLHRLGIVHGRITTDHVVLAADGRPVLCGFAEGRSRATAAGSERTADDVAGLGTVLRELVQTTDEAIAVSPSPRLSRRRSSDAGTRAVLLNLADHATADEPERRPTAAQLADAIRTAVPDASLSDRESDRTGSTRRRIPSIPTRRRSAVAGAALSVVLVAGAAALGADGDASPAPTSAAAAATTSLPAVAGPSTSSAPAPTSPSTAPGPDHATLDAADGCVTDQQDGATVIGGPCPVTVRYGDGALQVGDLRFDVGLASASAAIGDFSCTGSVVPAVLDHAAGDVFVFDAWARSGTAVRATATTQVPGARQLLAEPTSPRCHRLVVLDEWGIRHPVTTTPEVAP